MGVMEGMGQGLGVVGTLGARAGGEEPCSASVKRSFSEEAETWGRAGAREGVDQDLKIVRSSSAKVGLTGSGEGPRSASVKHSFSEEMETLVDVWLRPESSRMSMSTVSEEAVTLERWDGVSIPFVPSFYSGVWISAPPLGESFLGKKSKLLAPSKIPPGIDEVMLSRGERLEGGSLMDIRNGETGEQWAGREERDNMILLSLEDFKDVTLCGEGERFRNRTHQRKRLTMESMRPNNCQDA